MPNDPRDYMADYRDYWSRYVEDEQGNLDRDKVARELSDFLHMKNEVPIVYSEITGGTLSKPNYYASSVISVYGEYLEEIIADAIDDFLSDYDIPDPRKEETA